MGHREICSIALRIVFYEKGKYDQPELLFKKSLVIWENVLGKKHPSVAKNLCNLAELFRAQGKYAEAEPLYQRSLAIRKETLEENGISPQVLKAADLQPSSLEKYDVILLGSPSWYVNDKDGQPHETISNLLENTTIIQVW